jgi:ribosomal protein S18 acetylase RimI-like enzyme
VLISDPVYEQRAEIPDPEEYRALRSVCGLSPRSAEAAAKGLPNSLFATTIRDQSKLIAMGRVVGDGACNFEIVDVAVHPDYQRRSQGSRIMSAIMDYIHAHAPDSAYVSLIADNHAPALYSKFGFEPTAPASIGMSYKVRRRRP